MAIGIIDPDALHRLIEQEVREAVRRDLELIAEEACESLRQKIAGQADALAFKLLREYDVRSMADRVIITVKKDT